MIASSDEDNGTEPMNRDWAQPGILISSQSDLDAAKSSDGEAASEADTGAPASAHSEGDASALGESLGDQAAIPSTIAFVPVEQSGPLFRPYGVAVCLAGFLQQHTMHKHISQLASLTPGVLNNVISRLGRASELPPVPNAGKPAFERVSETAVLRLLDQVAPRMTAPGLENLIGFEWVEIAPLIAGRLVTEMEPWPESMPALDEIGIARFCLLSSGKLPRVQVTAQDPLRPMLVSALPVEVAGAQHQLLYTEQDGIEVAVLVTQYAITQRVQPIRVLVANERAIALTGLSRLLALHLRGVKRALCAVSYGYGIDAGMAQPTVDPEDLYGSRPPLVADFANDNVATRIPVRAPISVLNWAVQTVTG